MGEEESYEMYFMNGDKKVPVGKPVDLKFDALQVVEGKREREVREVRLEYAEYHGESSRSVSVETTATFKELRKLVRDLRDGR